MDCDIDGLTQAIGASVGFMVGRSIVMEWNHRLYGRLGHASVIWDGPIFHWQGLWVTGRGPGVLTGLTQVVPDFLRHHSIERITAVGNRSTAWQWLEAVGFETVTKAPDWFTQEWREAIEDPELRLDDPETALLVVSLDPPSRLDEYGAWKCGDASEPAWHQSVAQRRKLALT